MQPNADERRGTFLVTHVDEDSAVVRDVETAQVHTLSSPPDLDVDDVLEATIAPDPPLDVCWQVRTVHDHRQIEIVDSDLEPTRRSKELAGGASVGDLVRDDRAGTGEIHVLRVSPSETGAAVRDVCTDNETIARAARLGASRVEVRSTSSEGILSVRYLPD